MPIRNNQSELEGIGKYYLAFYSHIRILSPIAAPGHRGHFGLFLSSQAGTTMRINEH